MNNPFEEIFKRLENIEKMIAPVTSAQPEERQDGKAVSYTHLTLPTIA